MEPPHNNPIAHAYGRLSIHASFNPLQWGLFFKYPWIDINGQAAKGKWGQNTFDLPPGRYTVKVSAPMFFMKTSGLGETQVDVYAGYDSGLKYYAPFLLLLTGGQLKQVTQEPMQALPPG